MKHHTYLGDTTVGEDVNIGAGTITANYDGKEKNKTVIEDNAFIGVGAILIAPVKIGKGAVVGAGASCRRTTMCRKARQWSAYRRECSTVRKEKISEDLTMKNGILVFSGNSNRTLTREDLQVSEGTARAMRRSSVFPTARSASRSTRTSGATTSLSSSRPPAPSNDNLMELLIMIDALKQGVGAADHGGAAVFRIRPAGP